MEKKLTLVSVRVKHRLYSGFFMLDANKPVLNDDIFLQWVEDLSGFDLHSYSRNMTITVG